MSTVPIRPAATVVVLREPADARDPFDILMVRRSDHVAFMAGSYVFPGGRVDEGDYPAPHAELRVLAAREGLVGAALLAGAEVVGALDAEHAVEAVGAAAVAAAPRRRALADHDVVLVLHLALALREEIAFFQAIKGVIAKATETDNFTATNRKGNIV